METTRLPGYDLLYHGAGFARHTAGAVLRLQGKDTIDLLHRLTTNAVNILQQGQVLPTIFTNDKGRIIDYVHLVAVDNCVYIFGSKGRNEMLLRWLTRYIIMDDVTVTDETKNVMRYEVLGPHSPGFLYLLLEADTHTLLPNTVITSTTEAGTNYLYSFSVAGHTSLFLFGRTEQLEKTLEEQFANTGAFDAGFVSEEAYNLYRIENGLPTEAEVNDAFNPHETEMLHAVSFKKGCYIGQEVIARLDTYDKVQKKLRVLKIDGKTLPVPGERVVTSEGEDAGIVTSCAFSPKLHSAVALGFVKKAFAAEGTHLQVLSHSGPMAAMVKNNLR